MPGLVDCGVVLRTALLSDNAFFMSFDQSGLAGPCSQYSSLEACWFTPLLEVNRQIPLVPFLAAIQDAALVNMLAPH